MARWLKRIVFGQHPLNTFKRSIIIALVCFLIFKFLLIPVKIEGRSMEPTYKDGSFIFVNTLSYRFRKPQDRDIVAIRMAGRKVMLLKRVIGLEGEHLSFRDGNLLIDGKIKSEDYIKTTSDWNMPEVEIGKDEFFVAGDNREMPIEGHVLGRVAASRIIGGPLL